MNVGLVAHDNCKGDLCDWIVRYRKQLHGHQIYATGTTGARILERCENLSVRCLKSGPLGGDQQLGGLICESKLDMLIFFIDPLSPHPHDVDIKALMRLAILYDIPHAFNQSTASLLVNSLDDIERP